MEEERWIHIPELPYRVSNYGRVYSELSDRLITGELDDSGYRRLTIRWNGEISHVYVHRWVAWGFVYNWYPLTKVFVNHIDGNKSNNFYRNLEWCTLAENSQHAVRTHLQVPPDQERRRRRVLEVRNGFITRTFDCAQQAAQHAGCSYKKIDNVCRRRPLLTQVNGSFYCFEDWLIPPEDEDADYSE